MTVYSFDGDPHSMRFGIGCIQTYTFLIAANLKTILIIHVKEWHGHYYNPASYQIVRYSEIRNVRHAIRITSSVGAALG